MTTYLVILGIAFLTSFLLAPAARAAASWLGALDLPGKLTIHDRPVPRTGGVAIVGGFLAATVYALWRGNPLSESHPALTGVMIGGALIALAGLLDDARQISPISKFLCQFLAASIAIGMGVQTSFLSPIGVGLALTLLYLVGSANAMNLLDGMDGLAGGVSVIAALGLGLIGAAWGNERVVVLSLALAGATLGFLPFNFPRARLFMGDGGSLFLGFNLAALGALLADRPYGLLRFAVPLVALGVPILDTTLALIRRFRRRSDLFSGDRDHVYDVLARRWDEQKAVLVVWGTAAFLGCAAITAAWIGGWLGLIPIIAAIALTLHLARVSGVWEETLPSAEDQTSDRGGLAEALARLRQRYMHPALLDLATIVVSFYLALGLRFSGERPGDLAELARYAALLTDRIFFVAFTFAVSASIFGLYNRVWRYASSQEVLDILGAGATGTLVVLIVDLFAGAQRPIPLSVVLVGGFLTTSGLVALRYRWRLIRGALWRLGVEVDTTRERAIIVGAGEAGQLLAWRMQHQNGHYEPVGFVDDNPDKVGMRIHGVRILGPISRIPRLAAKCQADLVVIAMHEASQDRLNDIFDICQRSSARIQILPDVMGQLDASNDPSAPRDLTIEDLVGRSPRRVDSEACRSLIEGRGVLVTGAAGSIGSELCRQVSRYGPRRLLALDQDETGLYNLKLALQGNSPHLKLLVGDVTNRERMEEIWRRHRPAVVFHCAAYKHVPILENFPNEAVWTNVQGTRTVARLARRWGAERFVLISSDKAACPANVMGASKRVGELLTMAMQSEADSTRFAVVRFGNVLGSRGSVVPTFEREIAAGGPVTVTHPAMKRYFMSIEEAVSLVIQAGAYTQGGDLFVLDMGEEVLIKHLARKMIRLRGLRAGEDIQIEYTGVRPGEKLSEILHCSICETLEPTCHAAILRMHNHIELPRQELLAEVDEMIRLADRADKQELTESLFEMARFLCPEDCGEYEQVGK